MIQNPIGIILLLILIETFILALSSREKTGKWFKILPAVFWIYFLPMVFSTCKILPSENGIYQKITTAFLPAALTLLLVGVNIRQILGLGRRAILLMLAGSIGVMAGAVTVLLLFKERLPEDAWMGLGTLSASWIGGSANMVAIKEALGTPDRLFLPLITVDVIVAYTWMGILIVFAKFQDKFDRWNRSSLAIVESLKDKTEVAGSNQKVPTKPSALLFILMLVLVGSLFSNTLAGALPEIKGVSRSTWSIMIASGLGILLSFTPARGLESSGASRYGYICLYFVLTAIGARANLSYILEAPLFILIGFVWVAVHFVVLLFFGRVLKSPLALTATASQANIGGPVSAPIVAAIYEPSLAPVGLLLGIFGNIIGTYAGFVCAHVLRMISEWMF